MARHALNRYHLRKDFARIKKILDMPNLLDVQKRSYEKFLQRDLQNEALGDFGLHRTSKYEGLRQLQEAGLVSIVQSKGSSPSVTIKDPLEST